MGVVKRASETATYVAIGPAGAAVTPALYGGFMLVAAAALASLLSQRQSSSPFAEAPTPSD